MLGRGRIEPEHLRAFSGIQKTDDLGSHLPGLVPGHSNLHFLSPGDRCEVDEIAPKVGDRLVEKHTAFEHEFSLPVCPMDSGEGHSAGPFVKRLTDDVANKSRTLTKPLLADLAPGNVTVMAEQLAHPSGSSGLRSAHTDHGRMGCGETGRDDGDGILVSRSEVGKDDGERVFGHGFVPPVNIMPAAAGESMGGRA